MFEYRGLLDRSVGDPLAWTSLFQGFDRLFREFDPEAPITSFGYAPAELVEEDGRFVLSLEAPGLSDRDVRVDLNGGVLTVTAERPVEVPEGYTARRRERVASRFSRSFVLGDKIDPEKTTAQMKDGILTVDIPKSADQRKRSITVKAS